MNSPLSGVPGGTPLWSRILDGSTNTARSRALQFASQLSEWSSMGELASRASGLHREALTRSHGERARASLAASAALLHDLTAPDTARTLTAAWQSYLTDRAQRLVLTLDTLRERGDTFIAHEEAGCPPVLAYDYDIVIDGADLPRPCSYMLLRIRPPAGVTVRANKRPYIIIDPRAGHGAGIGGFKYDSQVGVALKGGHPVYFVSFRRKPEPGQTLADVTRAEATFVRRVQAEHPDAPKPVVIGNCQGGWATLLLGATSPDITGPLVLNGAPVSTWSGSVGADSMRYSAGLKGGQIVPMWLADLGNGIFDGAWLVHNFEMLNPSRNYFRKYYDLFTKIDTERPRFLEFEKWWGGFFLLNEQEIVWIVRELFVGNKLARNEARLEHGRSLDLKQIRSPVIVFASYGDNITPPYQALNWIADTYADETEIRIRGQRIVYMVHESVGHLGIFVSSSIARREHTEVASTLKTIEALAPGLYEMVIDDEVEEDGEKHFVVSFKERRIADLPGQADGRQDEIPFAAVARLSEMEGEYYDVFARPLVRAGVSETTAELSRNLHPLRVQRSVFASGNPLMKAVESVAERVKDERKPVAATNPFVRAEQLGADILEQTMDFYRDVRDGWHEVMFYSLYSNPLARWFGAPYAFDRTRKSQDELFLLPDVQTALKQIRSGGFVEAVIRMLILLADARGTVRRDRLERSQKVLSKDAPFSRLDPVERTRIIHQQSLIVEFAGADAIATLPDLLPDAAARALAAEVMQFVPGPLSEMEPHTLARLQEMRAALGLPPATTDVTEDPLQHRAAPLPPAGGAA